MSEQIKNRNELCGFILEIKICENNFDSFIFSKNLKKSFSSVLMSVPLWFYFLEWAKNNFTNYLKD